jgi:hypothetical protein
MDFQQEGFGKFDRNIKMGDVGLPQEHICILFWENEKILK